MKYKLKDHELQKKLDDISSGAFLFSEALNEACEGISDFSLTACPPIRVSFGQTPGLSHAYEVYFNPDQIEKVPEYNPHAWNRFPEVTPPEGVWMRCEWLASIKSEYSLVVVRTIARYVADGDSNEMIWIDYEGRKVEVYRFRPWDD